MRFACDFETGASDCAARITDAGGGFCAAGAARGGSTSVPTIAPGSIFRGFCGAGAARAGCPASRGAGTPGRAVAGAAPWFFGPGLCPLGAGIAGWLPGAIGLCCCGGAMACAGTAPYWLRAGGACCWPAGGWPYGWP